MAYIAPSAQAFDSAQVHGSACVFDSAQVYGSARVYGSACVSGSARVSGSAHILGDGRVSKPGDYITVGPAISSGRFTTAHVDETIGVRVNCGCFTGTVEEFRQAIEATHAESAQHLAQYRAFVALIKAHFAIDRKEA